MSVDDVVLPALLRAARGCYSNAIRASLRAHGFHDLPRNGPHVLGGLVNQGEQIGNLVHELDISKQAASQLVDTLVVRGYLKRSTDPADRRRVVLEPTEKGVAAADAVRVAVRAVDAELRQMITPDELAGMRAGLIALADVRERMADAARAGARNPFDE